MFILDTLEDIEKSEESDNYFNKTMPRHNRNMTQVIRQSKSSLKQQLEPRNTRISFTKRNL